MRRVLGSCLLLILASCNVEAGASLEVVGVAELDASCDIGAPPTLYMSRDLYDPRGFIDGGVPGAYELPLNIKNDLVLAEQDPYTNGFSANNDRPDTNDIEIVGFDVCWFRADPESGNAATQYGTWESGVPDSLKCDALPASQKAVVPASGYIKAGGGLLGIGIEVLDLAALQSLYGSAFEPASIPARGLVEPGSSLYSFMPGDPSLATRDAAWGNYPSQFDAPVVLQAQAIGKTQDGSSQRSDWVVFPVDVCVGCLADYCGYLNVTTTPCTVGGGTQLVGEAVDLANDCRPAQQGHITCLDSWTSCK